MSTHALNDFYTYRKLNTDQFKYEYEITVSSQYIKQATDSELKKIAKNVKLPGFRAGKAPYDLVVSNYKREAVERALNDAIEHCSDDLIQKNKMERYTNPKVKIVSLPNVNAKNEEGNLVYRLSFNFTPEVPLTEVPLIDVSKINLNTFKLHIEESDIKEFIDNIKGSVPNFISVNDDLYQAQSGDRMTIDFEGRIRGKIFKGGSYKNYTLDLGSSDFIVNGLENKLIGLKKGETKTFQLRFPEDHAVESLAGQEADFFVHVIDIKIRGKFENYDDLAKAMDLAGSAELREHVKKVITLQCQHIMEPLIKEQLFKHLDIEYHFDLLEDLIKVELQRAHADKELEPEKEARKRAKFVMLFMKFCIEHKFKLTNDDCMAAALKYHKETQYKNNKFIDYNELNTFLRKNLDSLHMFEGIALEYKVTHYIIERANKEQQDISVKALVELFDNTFKEATELGEK